MRVMRVLRPIHHTTDIMLHTRYIVTDTYNVRMVDSSVAIVHRDYIGILMKASTEHVIFQLMQTAQ